MHTYIYLIVYKQVLVKQTLSYTALEISVLSSVTAALILSPVLHLASGKFEPMCEGTPANLECAQQRVKTRQLCLALTMNRGFHKYLPLYFRGDKNLRDLLLSVAFYNDSKVVDVVLWVDLDLGNITFSVTYTM